MTRSTIWAFDVDGTLIGSIRSDRLRPGVADLLGALRERNVSPLLWSAGGADYAYRMARRHEIEDHFIAFYAKEARDDGGRYKIDHLAPEHRPHTFVDDVPTDMPVGAHVIPVSQFLGGNPADRVLLTLHTRLDDHLAASSVAVEADRLATGASPIFAAQPIDPDGGLA